MPDLQRPTPCSLFSVFCILLPVSCLLTSCTVGPNYEAPENTKNIQIQEVVYPELRYEQTDLSHWWDIFADPILSSLISRAEENNLDIKIAIAQVTEARAIAGIAASEMYPTIDGGGAIATGQESKNVNPLGGIEQTKHSLFADFSWEIDLFGRLRRYMEVSTAEYEATMEQQNGVLITIRAEVVRTYLNIRTLQAQLATAQKNIKSQKSMLHLTRVRYKTGLATYLDVAQAKQVLASTEADLPTIKTNLSKSISSLAVLVREATIDIRKEMEEVTPIPMPPAMVTVGIPAERIKQRPDIRKAERRLASQTARIGVATADLYPTFSLTGTLGAASLQTSNFFDSDSLTYGFGPSFSWNIFSMGRIRRNIEAEDARTEQALHSLELTILEAIKEVEDSITAYHEQRNRLAALEKTVKASKETLSMSTKLYKDGLTGFQDVLDAQRSLLVAENNLDLARGNTGIQLVSLYKSLAGGWTTPVENEKQSKE